MTNRPIGSQAKRTALQDIGVRRKSWTLLIIAVIVSLLAYQLEHHGLWGKLINYSKTPQISLAGTGITSQDVSLGLYRTEGPATYGAFIVQVTLEGVNGHRSWEVWGPKSLASLPHSALSNRYHFQKVNRGPWGLIVPLAAKAQVRLPLNAYAVRQLKDAKRARIIVQDVSGIHWSRVVRVH
ncbi:MAG: hypothetical protein M1596_03100 [Firmicutes bacterium]|nr:hypothetical protein [Bacillota bacterium]